MLYNYFKVAFRNIVRQRFYAAINIFGMTTGVLACLMIFLHVADELSYDRFHSDVERIYQLGIVARVSDQDVRTSNTCPPLVQALVTEVPGVESGTRLARYGGNPSIKYGEKMFSTEQVFYADSNFFSFFSFRLIEGNPQNALSDPNSVVLTPAIAEKYFGSEPALGKLININDEKQPFKVTGIAEEAPTNSHFHYSVLISASSNEELKHGVWLNNWMYSYIKLTPGASVNSVEGKFPPLVDKYIGPEMERFLGVTLEKMIEQGASYGYVATPLADLRLHSTMNDAIEAGGNLTYVYFFSGIGLFILVIACINFMNLSTARSAGRAKEVGLRKALGSQRAQMVFQFMAESVLYSLVAVGTALMLCYLLLPQFNLLAGKELEFSSLVTPKAVGAVVLLILGVGLVSGSYPAFYLTSFSAVEVLKGKVRAGMKSKGVRSGLVVLQFFISIFLIIFTAVVYQQISFMSERNAGLDKQNVLVIRSTDKLGGNKEAFRNALVQQTGVDRLSYTNNNFPGVNSTTVFRSSSGEQDHIMGVYFADYDHLDLMKFELAEGRYFSRDFPSDSTGIVLNEAAAKEFGFKHPVGQEILFNGGGSPERFKVIGVIKNFNFESFRAEVRPLAIRLTPSARFLYVRYNGSATELVAKAEALWKQHTTNQPFSYTFLDEEFDQLFRAEQRMGMIFTLFSGLAIFIASLGLFALAAFTAEQRTKEIGIRKALGASSLNLTLVLSREFTTLVIIAFVPAAILGWFVSDQWLAGFSQRISIQWWVFLASGAGAIFIAWVTVSFQAIKAAIANPVNSLRYE